MRPRVLLAITVYNGREVVLRCLRSAALLSRAAADIDVLVLDDCSPAPGWSEELARVCAKGGFQYYRSPRNLGIVRNVNLGLLRALQAGYDAVIISNSDVIYPRAMVDRLTAVVDADPTIGSVTAWSNNVSIYSLPNADPVLNLASQEVVDDISSSLHAEFGDEAVDIPAGISFCIHIPTRTLRRVGLMDPVFGRGYCEETDWTLRSLELGFRLVLAPGIFVYHEGRASTAEAGMVAAGHSTVPAHEAIIDFRYPRFREVVAGFVDTGALERLHARALRRIVGDAAARLGYDLEVTWVPRHARAAVRCAVEPVGRRPRLVAEYRGFRHEAELADDRPLAEAVAAVMGSAPANLRVADRGAVGDRLAVDLRAAGVPVEDSIAYPTRV